jgi:deoxyribodipyrimidine photo-lyase
MAATGSPVQSREMTVPDIRIQVLNAGPVDGAGDFVLYWMIAYRRVKRNFALQRAAQWARELGKPLVILEALRSGYPWASDRLHRFVLDGMADNTRLLESKPVCYYPYVEPVLDVGKGLLATLAGRACVVVTDDFPAFMLPRMVAAAARQLAVRLEHVDSNGLLPLRTADRMFTTAYSFRRFLQQTLRWHLLEFPEADPLAGAGLPRLHRLPEQITERWPKAKDDLLFDGQRSLAALPIDHSVPATATRGGSAAAEAALRRFLDERLARYAEARNQPEEEVTSELSPYLHFGHISAHQVFVRLMAREGWSIGDLATVVKGSRSGWWGMSPSVEAFLDQLVTWRELGFNMCWQREDYDRFESLPQWAIKTLSEHARDPRPYFYDIEELESGRTHDPLWNAAQMQLAREGRIHNYLRMLWGKKILEWTESPQEALAVMIELNNKYALDGRDPNSYSGIFWCLGRYDRPWGPERPIFGKVRYMSSERAARKLRVTDYISKYAL